MDLSLITFFGWASVVNLGFLLFSTLAIMIGKGTILAIHTRLFNLSHETLMTMYLGTLGIYKILIILFCIVPWIVLRFLM